MLKGQTILAQEKNKDGEMIMTKENNQNQQPKPEPDQRGRITINESIKSDRGRSPRDTERFRKGNAGDTDNTGPRRNNES